MSLEAEDFKIFPFFTTYSSHNFNIELGFNTTNLLTANGNFGPVLGRHPVPR